MKSLGQIYHDIEHNQARWYEKIWLVIAVIAVGIAATPGALWRNFTRTKSKAEIEADKYRGK